MDFLIQYDIELPQGWNAVPIIKPSFEMEDEWFASFDTPDYQEKLKIIYGKEVAAILIRWSIFLRKYYESHPPFIVKAVQAIFKMAKEDGFFKQQSVKEFQYSKQFIEKILKQFPILKIAATNPIKKTHPLPQLIRVALIFGRYHAKNDRTYLSAIKNLDGIINTKSVRKLLDELALERADKTLLLMYLNNSTY